MILAEIRNQVIRPAVFKDRWEHELIRDFFGETPRVFVDVGANYPGTSVSTGLEARGWTGVVIEPQPDCAAALREVRKCAVIQAACVARGSSEGSVRLFVAGPKSSLDKGFISPRVHIQNSILVEAKTLTQILDECSIQTIDLLSLDTEGTEIDVMDGLDWNRFDPKIVLLEDNAIGFSKHMYMIRKGYVLFRRTGLNSWYAKPEDALPISVFGRIQIFRKYILSMPIRRFRRWRHATFG